MIDSDKMFEKHLKEWIKKHGGEFTADETEDMLPELYEKWVTSPLPELGGISPEQYFENITDPQELVGAFKEANKGEGNACSLLLDRIVEVKECAPLLRQIVEDNADPKLTVAAMNVLEESGAEQSYELYADWLTDGKIDDGVRELAAEILKNNADAVKERLFSAIDKATADQKQIIADVLVEAGKDERTFKLLKELFLGGDNVPYTAGLLGKYGDERAAEFMYPALDDCNYLEFIEIRNAIEQMGGVVDDSYRDFSDDEYYKAIKHLK